jgi:integrase
MNGSITKRTGTRGTTWYGRYDYADPATGKRVYRRVSAPTRKECEALLRAAIQKAESGAGGVDERLTVREYLVDRWLPALEPTVRPATYRRYLDVVRHHVLPTLGGLRLSKLSALDLQALYADRLATGLSPTTVHHLHAVLHRALGQAMRLGLLERNVCDLVDAPRRAAPLVQAWDARHVVKVLDIGDATDLAALWRVALLCGLRRGELLGLKWEDVDLEQGTLAVRRSLIRGKGGTWQLGEPKTASGRRSIALDATCVAALRKHRAAQNAERLRLGPVWEDLGFVFTNETGGPLHVNALMVRYERLVREAGVPRIRFHDLRHTSATLALVQGIHPKIVQERLGHSTVAMTLDRYSHVTPGLQQQAAEQLAAALEAAREAAS